MTALEKLLHIDIPVNLSNVKIVFSIGALAFEGDLPSVRRRPPGSSTQSVG